MSVNVILLSQLYPHPPPSSSGRAGLGYLIVVPHTCCSSQCFLSMSVRLGQASCLSSFQKRSAYLEASPSFFLCHLMTTQVIVISLDYKLRVGTKTLEWIFASADWVGLVWLACCSMLKCMWFCIVVVVVVVFNMISIQTSSTVNGKVTRLQRKEKKNKRIFN